MEREGEKGIGQKRKIEKRFVWVGVWAGAAAVALQVMARNIPWFGDWYAKVVYPVLLNTVGRICGLFPFSMAEAGIYLLFIGYLWYGIRHRREWWRIISAAFALVACLLLAYTLGCGINYYRAPFSKSSGLAIEGHTKEELERLCFYLTERVNETAPKGTKNRAEEEPDGRISYGDDMEPGGRINCGDDMEPDGREAMEKLGERYQELSGFYPRPKKVWISRILSVQQITGIYSPFTIEANYNGEITTYNIPHTICHELSHLKGFMREDEANFIGYLACIGADNSYYNYSGYLTGWIYATNALYDVNAEAYYQCYAGLKETVKEDLRDNSLFWDRFDTKVAKVSSQMNDAYLKFNSQTDGVESYGRVVDLLLEYYREALSGS